MLVVGDLALFELKVKPQGLTIHLLEFDSELSYRLQEGDVLEFVNDQAVDSIEAAINAIKLTEFVSQIPAFFCD